jgi:hypothetical protein
VPTDNTRPPEDDPSPEQDHLTEQPQPGSPEISAAEPLPELPDEPPGDETPLVYKGKARELFRMGI